VATLSSIVLLLPNLRLRILDCSMWIGRVRQYTSGMVKEEADYQPERKMYLQAIDMEGVLVVTWYVQIVNTRTQKLELIVRLVELL